MLSPTDWHPVAPSHALDAGSRLMAARVLGQDLVLWRSQAGVAQVWHDRCPHRGVRLSLGRVLDGRLSCAYHGWEFAPGTGRCEVIPALADLAQVPGRAHARVYPTTESRQMVWVQLPPDDKPAVPSAPPAGGAGSASAGWFLRSIALRAGLDRVSALLHRRDFLGDGTAAWRGTLADRPVRLFLQCAQADLTLVHAWACEGPAGAAHGPALDALRWLRSDAEAGA